MQVQYTPLSIARPTPRPAAPAILSSPHFSGAQSDDAQANAFLGILSVLGLLVGLGFFGTGKIIHRYVGVGPSQRTVQTNLDTFQASKNLPSQGKTQFKDVLERLQEQIALEQPSDQTALLKTIVPELTPEETAQLDQIRAKASTVTRAQDLMPVFDEWLDMMAQHAPAPLDKAKIKADAQNYFESLKTHNAIQTGFTLALVGVVVLAGLGIRQAMKS